MGPVRRFLGINITRDKKAGILQLDQKDYIEALLKKFNMYECNGSTTPMDPGITLCTAKPPKSQAETQFIAAIPYQNAVGILLYIYLATRPDLSYAVSTVS